MLELNYASSESTVVDFFGEAGNSNELDYDILYVYRGWDDVVYLTVQPDGNEGLLMQVNKNTSFGMLYAHLEFDEVVAVFGAFLGNPDADITVYDI